MADIDVTRGGEGSFHVSIREGGSATEHEVTVAASDLERLGSGYASPEEFVRACFTFLLQRESKESILSSFDVTVIGRYFPEFETTITRG